MSSLNFTESTGPDSSQELPVSNTPSRSSPQRPQTYLPGGRKERRNPSVTPRKFNRFFTPRLHGTRQVSSARQALNEITTPFLNRNVSHSSPLRPFRSIGGQENSPTNFPRYLKRRKTTHTPEQSPEHAYAGTKEHGFLLLQDGERPKADGVENIQSSPCERIMLGMDVSYDDEEFQVSPQATPLKHIVPLVNRGLGAQLLSLRIGGGRGPGRQNYVYPVNDYQDETSSFYTRPDDIHVTTSIEGPDQCIPFCTTACNTSSLVAVGDEEGRVRLIESAKGGTPSFKDYFLAFRVHTNAIIDMTFSEDDRHLATASGDQSARVVDMGTQTTTAVLGCHNASLKQVRFQPGTNNNSILATSSRDGIVQIWDLRCKGDDGPQHQMYLPVEQPNRGSTRSASDKVLYGRPVNSIDFAHLPWNHSGPIAGRTDSFGHSTADTAFRLGDVSVTAIQFLPVGQEHLLLTASEADASVRLWDVRFLYSKHKSSQTPISITQHPQSHSQWRHFGVNSLNLSSDGARLYTLCKDNTVYAYSTAHMILGHAPELSTFPKSRPGPQRATREGLGPLYAYRHPQLHATSFYVKTAIRTAKDGKCEMLAVGSSDGCAILFPTDERYLPKPQYGELELEDSGFCTSLPRRPMARRVGSGSGIGGRVEESIPISTNGTPLVRGHDREIGSLTWSNEGDLITVGDDFLVRCWREGEDARDLRGGGEGEGRRWGCGWADVDEKYDEDDD